MTSSVTAATDGSSLGNPGHGGWAWYIDEDTWAAGHLSHATNQQAELFAVLALLRAVPTDVALHIRTDSQYTLKLCTSWIATWKAKGWRRADGGPLANLDLVRELDLALAGRRGKVTFAWVAGHTGDPLNEHADARCTAASAAGRAGQRIAPGPGWSGGPTGRHTPPPTKPAAPARGSQQRRNSSKTRSKQPEAGPVTVRRIAPGALPKRGAGPSPLNAPPPARGTRSAPAKRATPRRTPAPARKPQRRLPTVEDFTPSTGPLCASCNAPINPYTFACRCTR